MQRPSGFCEAQYQATGRIFVIRIFFDNSATANCLQNLGFTDISFDCPAKGVARELEFALCQLSKNLLRRFHAE